MSMIDCYMKKAKDANNCRTDEEQRDGSVPNLKPLHVSIRLNIIIIEINDLRHIRFGCAG